MLETFSLGRYVLLVEYTGRLFRNGKARINADVKDVLERLGTDVNFWFLGRSDQKRIKKMLGSSELRGCFFGADDKSVTRAAEQRGVRTPKPSPQLSPPG